LSCVDSFHVLTAADGLECGESYEILVMQGDAQTETIVARTLACDGSDDDAACVCDCGSDYEEDDCADSTSWYCAFRRRPLFFFRATRFPSLVDKKSKDTCADYVTKKSKNCRRGRVETFRRSRARRRDRFAGKKYGVDDVLAEDACPVTCGAC
jgi:hypothetical protein